MPLGVMTVSIRPVRFPTAASALSVTADIADIPHWVKPRHSSLKTLESLQVTRNQLYRDLSIRSFTDELPPCATGLCSTVSRSYI